MGLLFNMFSHFLAMKIFDYKKPFTVMTTSMYQFVKRIETANLKLIRFSKVFKVTTFGLMLETLKSLTMARIGK